MPVISMFYGLIVSMYYLDTKKHKLPHIHVKYAEQEGVYQIPDGNLLEGAIPSNKERLIIAWIEIRVCYFSGFTICSHPISIETR